MASTCKKSRGRTVEELKERHKKIGLDTLCKLFGITRQGLWKQKNATFVEEIDNTAIISEVKLIREDMPRLGTRKIQIILAEKRPRDRKRQIVRTIDIA